MINPDLTFNYNYGDEKNYDRTQTMYPEFVSIYGFTCVFKYWQTYYDIHDPNHRIEKCATYVGIKNDMSCNAVFIVHHEGLFPYIIGKDCLGNFYPYIVSTKLNEASCNDFLETEKYFKKTVPEYFKKIYSDIREKLLNNNKFHNWDFNKQ